MKWLAYEPTFELVMKPLATAKFLGFLLKGLCHQYAQEGGYPPEPGCHLVSALPWQQKVNCQWMDQVDNWYANLIAGWVHCLPVTLETTVDLTLWEAWENSHQLGFKAAFQVGCCPAKRLPVRALACTLDSDPCANCRPTPMQAAGRVWCAELARQCHDAGLRVLVAGVHQPPMRVGALRVTHSCKALKDPCILPCRDPASCSLNSVEYYKDRRGTHAELVLHHFKNEAMKGEQRLPLSPKLVEVFALLEQAANAANSRSLLQPVWRALPRALLLHRVWWIAYSQGRCTANTFRHLFTRLHGETTADPKTQLLDLTIQQLDAATP